VALIPLLAGLSSCRALNGSKRMPPRLTKGEYYGETLRSRNVAGLVLTETRYAPGARIPWHSHENAYFCLVRQGSYTENFDGRTRRCEPMTLAFHPAGELHAEDFHDGPALSFNIELGPEWRNRLGRHSRIFEDGKDFQGGELAALSVKLLRELNRNDGASQLAIEGLTLELLASATRLSEPKGSQKPPWVERAWQLVQDRFRESLGLKEVAALIGVHPVHLASTFRRCYGSSMGDVQRRRRIEFAAGRLACSSDPLSDIAQAAGFSDQSHFCNTFKRIMGLTPSGFRRSVRAR
jgi:AraC family transcriptional regulator